MTHRGSAQSPEVQAEVESLREQVEQMKSLVKDHSVLLDYEKSKKKKQASDSIINGSFLSFIFLVVLVMIVGVSIYAFKSLFSAIIKKFNAIHTEL